MPLPHFTQLLMTGSPGGPGTKPQEPVYKNLFEITFIVPTILQAQGRSAIMLLQQATSIDLNLTEDIERATQRFKYSTRKFVTTPSDTSKDFTIKFNVNVNEKGAMETWNALKAWYDLVWNSQNGVLHYKADIIGTIIVNEHDRKGLVLRRVTYQNAQIYGIDGISLDWSQNTEIWEVNAKFVADYWIDEYIDGNFVINPPRIVGYP
jgi:hypothetical protein